MTVPGMVVTGHADGATTLIILIERSVTGKSVEGQEMKVTRRPLMGNHSLKATSVREHPQVAVVPQTIGPVPLVANLSGEQLGSRTPRNSGPPRAGENGNWRCSVCGNVNYPSRDRCNGKGCGRQREEVEAKAHAPNTRSTRDTGAGNWVCPACSNLNYAHRTRCNRKQCGLPRPLGA
ncbi:hypothetical protein FOL47_011282 [Perkinsus chesapeaki]|uniref:RanBP2-type domain-containing protein n=1 Tax=Perkinsus chesapeaki TaxID=330153 RepID=A0A7J6MMQ6_PERCH|nr:hypothetical protein FOL47_011282 [Perkinsus chesapeaki]